MPGPPAASPSELLSKHRIEALTDGIYAVALTLLVLELRLPAGESHDVAELHRGLVRLVPKAIAWLISFGVLAIFWVAHHRAFHWVRHVDGKLMRINLVSLLFASLVPFCSSLVGEWSRAFVSQVVYALVMAALGLVSVWQLEHLVSHPALLTSPMPAGVVRAARVRALGLVATAAVAVLIAAWRPMFATTAFALMAVVNPLSRRLERAA